MEFLHLQFTVSGVETLIFIPPLVAFIISFFTSMGGISGAFLLLPFQVSILGFAAPPDFLLGGLFGLGGILGMYMGAKAQ